MGDYNGESRGVLRKIVEQDPWKQWLVVVSVVSMSFMAGMNVTGVIHVYDKEIHETSDQKNAATKAITDPILRDFAHHINTDGHGVMSERVSGHEKEAARQFAELSRQLEVLRVTQQQILTELRKH